MNWLIVCGLTRGFRRLDAGDKAARNLDSQDDVDAITDALIWEIESGRGTSAPDSASDTSDIEVKFHQAMISVYERAKAEANYSATDFGQMLSEHGGLETARQLLASSTPSQGFTALWEAGRLDLSVEAVVVRTEYASLFTRQELRIARRRLAEFGFQVG